LRWFEYIAFVNRPRLFILPALLPQLISVLETELVSALATG